MIRPVSSPKLKSVVHHRYHHGSDRDRGTYKPLPVGSHEVTDKGGCPNMDVDRGLAYRDALVLQGLARHGNPDAHRHNQALLTSFEGLNIELPGGDLVLGDTLLLVAVGRDPEPVTLESDCHQWRGSESLPPAVRPVRGGVQGALHLAQA